MEPEKTTLETKMFCIACEKEEGKKTQTSMVIKTPDNKHVVFLCSRHQTFSNFEKYKGN